MEQISGHGVADRLRRRTARHPARPVRSARRHARACWRCWSRSSTAGAPARASSSSRRWSRRRSTRPPIRCSNGRRYGASLGARRQSRAGRRAAEPLRLPRRRSAGSRSRSRPTRSGRALVERARATRRGPRRARSPRAAGRRAAHDAIDAALARVVRATATRRRSSTSLLAARHPRRAGRAGRATLGDNPQLRARGFFEAVAHPVTGTHELPGLPMRFSAHRERWYRAPAPTLGQHTDEVLRELLGLDDDEIAAPARRRHHRRRVRSEREGRASSAHPDGGERAVGLEGEAIHPPVEAKAAAVLVRTVVSRAPSCRARPADAAAGSGVGRGFGRAREAARWSADRPATRACPDLPSRPSPP